MFPRRGREVARHRDSADCDRHLAKIRARAAAPERQMLPWRVTEAIESKHSLTTQLAASLL